MAVRIAKPAVNIREKLAELERPIGVNGAALMRTETPQDAFTLISAGRKNRIINGNMVIDQRNSGASVTQNSTTPLYAVDRFKLNGQTTDGVYTGQRSTVVPPGFINSLLITVTTADTSIGATQEYFVNQLVEGSNISDLNWGSLSAKPVTLSFYVRSSIPGIFGGSLKNNGATRCYPYSYTINSANTWEYKTITIPGDTTGTWATNTSSGIEVYFSLGVGTSRKGTANTWSASNLSAPTNSIDLISTVNATMHITGVQLEEGKVATPFEYRSIGDELALCQRYFEIVATSGAYNNTFFLARCNGATQGLSVYSFKVPKRSTPTMTVTGTSSVYTSGSFTSVTSYSNLNAGTHGGRISFEGMSGLTLNDCFHVDLGAGFSLVAEAEL